MKYLIIPVAFLAIACTHSFRTDLGYTIGVDSSLGQAAAEQGAQAGIDGASK